MPMYTGFLPLYNYELLVHNWSYVKQAGSDQGKLNEVKLMVLKDLMQGFWQTSLLIKCQQSFR